MNTNQSRSDIADPAWGSDAYGSTAGEYFADEGRLVDIASLYSAIYRSRLLIAGILAGFVALGLIVTLLMTPKYTADALVRIDQEAQKVLGTEQSEASASIQDVDRFLKTEVQMISSRSTLTAVARELRLFDGMSFLEAMNEEDEIELNPFMSPDDSRREAVLKVLQDNLRAELPPDSRVVQLSFTSPDPILSARVANSTANKFIEMNLSRKYDNSAYARDFLQERLVEAQSKLADAERNAVEYARQTRIVDLAGASTKSGQNRDTVVTIKASVLADINEEAARAMAERIAAEERWQGLRGKKILEQPEVIENEAIQSLLVERAETAAKLEDETETRRDEFPAVRRLRAQIAELDRQIDSIARDIGSGVRLEYEIARERERSLNAKVEELKRESFDEQRQGIQLSILRREAETLRNQFEYLLRRTNELNAEAGVQANNISLVDAASVPVEPSSPKLVLNLLLAIIAGLACSAVVVFLRENLFNVVISPEDVENVTGLPVLGVIPNDEEDNFEERIVDPKTDLFEAYNAVRTALSLTSRSGFPQTLMVTSTEMSEGKSASVFALAVGLGRSGRRVLVADADLRRPNMHNYLGIENNSGLSQALTGNLSYEDAIRQTDFVGVSFVPAGPPPPNPGELLETQLESFLDSVRAQFDVILLDSPPVLGLSDALMVGSASDGALYVIESGRNLPKSIRWAINRLQKANVKIYGLALTKFDAGKSGLSYSYSYEYGEDERPATT